MKPTFTLLTALLLGPLATLHAIAPASLKTEFLENPLAVDTAKPRFSWIVEDSTPGSKQTAYQVQVASSPEILIAGEANLWDSGKFVSGETLGIEYGGVPLASRSSAWWRIRIWDGDGNVSGWSKPAMFSVGLLTAEDWLAKWISKPRIETETPHFGFRSADAKADTETKWVQVDLGSPVAIDGVALWGAWPVERTRPKGDGFPLRFKIEAAQQADFSDARVVVDRTAEDITKDISRIGVGPVKVGFPPITARYVRLTATKLSGHYQVPSSTWDAQTESFAAVPSSSIPKKDPKDSPQVPLLVAPSKQKPLRGWHLALAEMEVFSDGKNVALGAEVSASDSYEDTPPKEPEEFDIRGWKRAHLTDGRSQASPGSLRSPQPVTLLRKNFEIGRTVKRAVLYVTALGNYEARINGEKVGNHKLAPGWTVVWFKPPVYQTFDVTGMMRPGKNTLAAMLADGFYRMTRNYDHWGSAKRAVSPFPALFMAQLEIEYNDGQREVIATDGSWQCYTDGPIRSALMFHGIVYDMRKDVVGWDRPGDLPGWINAAVSPPSERAEWKVSVADHPFWINAALLPGERFTASAQMHEPIRVMRAIKPVTVTEPKPGVRIYDFGTSMAGFCRVTLDGSAGTEISLRYAEAIKPDGTLYVANLAGNYNNADRYILDGKGPRTIEPDFTYHGFRYVEVTGAGAKDVVKEIVALDISSDLLKIGFFESSDSRLNKLCDLVDRAYRSNNLGMAVDGAGRDERNPYLGDCFHAPSLAYLYASANFLNFAIQSWASTANEQGIPYYRTDRVNANNEDAVAGWTDAGIAGTWFAWVNFGNRRALATGYDAAARFMDSVAEQSVDGLPGKNYQSIFGDWLSARQTIPPWAKDWSTMGGKGASHDLFTAAFFAYSTDLTAKMAHALGKGADARRYEEMRDRTRKALSHKFVSSHGTIEGGEQSSYALALGMEHLPGELREESRARLLEEISRYDNHLATGSITTICLLRYLSNNGLQDLAYRMVMNPTPPSYGVMVDNGATAMWEKFDSYHPELGLKPRATGSFIHVGMNSVYEWIFGTIAGIRPDPEHAGYKHFFIEPIPPQSLDWVKASYNSVRGPIAVEWKKEGGGLNLKVSVPPNTSATVKLPDGTTKHLESGQHSLTIGLKGRPD